MTMYGLRHPILSKVTAATVLTALLAGIPTVLLAFFWPIDLPTLDDLATPTEPVVIKALLLGIVWTCWTLFAWAVLVELVDTFRVSQSRVRMPFQRLAAYLITTITLAATAPVAATRGAAPAAAVAVMPAPLPDHALMAAEPETGAPTKEYKTYVVKPRDTLWEIARKHLGEPMRYREIVTLNQGRVMDDGQTFTRGDWLRPGWTLRLPADAARLDTEHKAPEQGQAVSRDAERHVHTVASGESLWEIAEKRLGDGRRHKEIFKLNKGRVQPDGARLVDPDVLESGWRLTLPEREQAGRKPALHRPSVPARTDVTARPAAEPMPSAEMPAASAPSNVVVLPRGGMVALSFAAGVAVALAAARLRQRRRVTIRDVDEPVSVLAPEPEAPAVRALERAHRRSYAESDEAPPDDYDLVISSFPTDPPTALKVGTRGEEPVSLALSGLNLALTGPGADDCIRAIVLDLLSQADQHRAEIVIPRQDAERWFGAPILTMTDYLPGLRLAPELNDAIDHLEGQFVTRRRVLRDSEAEDIPELRDAEPDEPLPALLLTACSLEGHSYLDTLMGLASGFDIGALMVGRSAFGTTCEVGEDHQVAEASGALVEKLRDTSLFHLPQESASAVLHKLAVGNGMPAEQPTQEVDLSVPPPGTAERRVRLSIVGEPIVEVDGKMVDISGRTKALELFVLLAVHPKGLEREEICEYLWPDVEETLAGYRFHSALKDLRVALRESTGLRDKEASFVERSGKTYRIEAEHVDVDLWTFHRALADARTAADGEAKTVALEAVAGLCRGRLGQGLRYDWIDQDHRWPLTVASVKALLQLGTLHERAGRNERALEVFDQACALDPDMESAARAAIRLLVELGRTDEARLRVRHLKARLAALGVSASSETRAVLDQIGGRPGRVARN
ncbi:LysM peptidoglycan-binding domain-containing protein [Microtetraspora malaysiensis]|uniref:LysM peptidoglycan-binding domain-containing protein n=1 Tax=Microtetraspora malaysiensis TaxID=161358 RepID=A0ABW6T2U4_9ACTN